jgi:hypothetical protein
MGHGKISEVLRKEKQAKEAADAKADKEALEAIAALNGVLATATDP